MGRIDHQIIRTEAGEELVVISRRTFEALTGAVSDEVAEDDGVARILAATQGHTALPGEAWDRIEAGENPIKVVRELRGLSQVDLARASNLSQAYLSKLERSLSAGTPASISALARSLGVSMDVLVNAD